MYLGEVPRSIIAVVVMMTLLYINSLYQCADADNTDVVTNYIVNLTVMEQR